MVVAIQLVFLSPIVREERNPLLLRRDRSGRGLSRSILLLACFALGTGEIVIMVPPSLKKTVAAVGGAEQRSPQFNVIALTFPAPLIPTVVSTPLKRVSVSILQRTLACPRGPTLALRIIYFGRNFALTIIYFACDVGTAWREPRSRTTSSK